MKQASQAAPTEPNNRQVRILKIASCPSLSGRSTLTYHVGCNAGTDASEILIRVSGNSGGGFFSNEWIALDAIQQALSKVPSGISITAHLLSPLFQGKSANTQAFLFAVLKHEGLVSTVPGSKGRYECANTSEFLTEVNALIASDVDLAAEEKSPMPLPEKPRKDETKSTPDTSGKKGRKEGRQLQGSTE